MNFRNIIQILVISLLLVGLPLGSWYYLKKGADFRRQHLQQMTSLGPFEFQDFVATSGDTLPPDSLHGRVLIICRLAGEASKAPSESILSDVTRLEKQFAERRDFKLLVFTDLAPASEVISRQRATFLRAHPAIEATFSEREGNPVWLLIDTKGEKRRFYESVQTDDLVTETAILLPSGKREEIELKRVKEK
jgi:hypothetical protein